MSLTTKEKLTKAIIQIQEEQPFWSRLILGMHMTEDTNNALPPEGGMGVDIKGNLTYKKEFVDKLNIAELKFVLSHECSHLIYHHLNRLGKRDPKLFNVSCDLVVNTILKINGFTPPSVGIFADQNHSFTAGTKIITDIDKKTAEQVYDEFPQQKQNYGKGFDVHQFSQMTESEAKECEDKINMQIIQARAYAKQRGKTPLGMDRYIGEIINPKVNWKVMLYKYITNSLMADYSWTKISKKGISNGIHLPAILKENLEVIIHIDTSGSVDEVLLKEFLSEIIGIAKSTKNIKMTVIECDATIQQILEVKNGNIDKIKQMKMKGGGGTSHKPVWDIIRTKYKNCKLLISFTDLYSDVTIIDKPRYDVIWAVPNDVVVPFGKIVRMK